MSQDGHNPLTIYDQLFDGERRSRIRTVK